MFSAFLSLSQCQGTVYRIRTRQGESGLVRRGAYRESLPPLSMSGTFQINRPFANGDERKTELSRESFNDLTTELEGTYIHKFKDDGTECALVIKNGQLIFKIDDDDDPDLIFDGFWGRSRSQHDDMTLKFVYTTERAQDEHGNCLATLRDGKLIWHDGDVSTKVMDVDHVFMPLQRCGGTLTDRESFISADDLASDLSISDSDPDEDINPLKSFISTDDLASDLSTSDLDPDGDPLKTTFPGCGDVSIWNRLTMDGAYVTTPQLPSILPLTSAVHFDNWALWAHAIAMKMTEIWDDTLAGGATPSKLSWIFTIKTNANGVPIHVRVRRFKLLGVPGLERGG